MHRFIRNILIFMVFPTVIVLFATLPYFITDPYMDFYKKQNYSWKYFFQQLGDVATKSLINSTTNYNSFIFGSSRTTGIYACYLNKAIADASFFHYGNWNEKIGGIHNKLQLIDTLGYKINNVILYIDTDFTFHGEGRCHFLDHYLVTKSSKIGYLKTHFITFYSNFTFEKIKLLYGYKVSDEVFPNWHSDVTTNDPNHNCNNPEVLLKYSQFNETEKLKLKVDSLKLTNFFYERPLTQEYKEEQISKSEKEILLKIKELFKKHATNYLIVITPLYDQLKFSTSDKKILKELFGDRLFDFSGKNKYTTNEYNYPDRKHFQPYISKCIIDSILKAQPHNIVYKE